MQLVVMAAVLMTSLVGAGLGCSSGCRLVEVSIPVESCGSVEVIETTVCAGQCYLEDPVYLGYADWAEQKICNGHWSYEVKHVRGCPTGVTYPRATHCECTACKEEEAYCGRLPGHIPSCMTF